MTSNISHDSDATLNKKQQLAYDYMCQGLNVFITGPGGTGKSLLIHKFNTEFRNKRTIAITSTTGISALLIGGTTLHSYAGIGLGNGTVDELYEKVRMNPKAKQRWNRVDTLIIDEISMLSPELLDKLDQLASKIRYSGASSLPLNLRKPFGGIQLIFAGDFLQLPVVNNSDTFAFESKSWEKCVHKVVHLTEIMRQKDAEFQKALSELRMGEISKETRKLLESRVGVELSNTNGIKPTKIFTTNAMVDIINEVELDNLVKEDPTLEFYEYETSIDFYDFVRNRNQMMEKYRKSCIAPEQIQLCKGAQVMLLHNLDLERGLANGSRGVVVDFIGDNKILPIVRFVNGEETIIDDYTWEIEEDGKKQVSITQMPLKLAWAVSVHRSQGCTLDYAEIDLSNVFEYGQAYVALSRVKTKDGLSISNINFDCIRAHPKARQYYQKIDALD